MNAQNNMPAVLRSLVEIVDEYDALIKAIPETIKNFTDAVHQAELNSTINGSYVGSIWGGGSPSIHENTLKTNITKSAWRHIYTGLNINRIATAAERKQFEASFENAPEFTIDNIRSTFGKYIVDPRHHILKGLAECFCDLDPAYKSHSKVKIGVAGLPKRIIITNCGSYGSWGYERLRDTLNALRVYQGLPHMGHNEFEDFLTLCDHPIEALPEWSPLETYRGSDMVQHKGRAYKTNGFNTPTETFEIKDRMKNSGWREMCNEERGMKLNRYMNGNAHLIFDKDTMHTINLALAEFYGEVLPDAEDDDPDLKPDLFKSREVSKDLQYYPTPRAVIDRVLGQISIGTEMKVLEPSCGDGHIMDVLREVAPGSTILGVETHTGRVAEARAKGHSVYHSNFLELAPKPEIDLIVMNPPFYGKHWIKHLVHARKFLKPRTQKWGVNGGHLICILPATAFYDGHLEELSIAKGAWTDLPVASFAESGTNVPTGYIIIGPEGE